MPPKVKVTREDIVRAAVEMVRSSGAQAINARTLAAALGCSTQPIFSNFATMDALRRAIVRQADSLCHGYICQEVAKGEYPAYKASGMAYIRFAKEEKELFKLLYMRDRTAERETEESVVDRQMENLVENHIDLGDREKELFHLEMWMCVHGIATMFATSFVDLDWDLVSKMLTDIYQGLRKRYGMEE